MEFEDRLALIKIRLGDCMRVQYRDSTQTFVVGHLEEKGVFEVLTANIFRQLDRFGFTIDEETGATVDVFTDMEGHGVEPVVDLTGQWQGEGRWPQAEKMVNDILWELAAPDARFEAGFLKPGFEDSYD